MTTQDELNQIEFTSRQLAEVVMSLDSNSDEKITSEEVFRGIYNALIVQSTNASGESQFLGIRQGNKLLSISSIEARIASLETSGFDASKITSGTLNINRIPNLPASKTTSGVFTTSLIPELPASKITSGTITRISKIDAAENASHSLIGYTSKANIQARTVSDGSTSIYNGITDDVDKSIIIEARDSEDHVVGRFRTVIQKSGPTFSGMSVTNYYDNYSTTNELGVFVTKEGSGWPGVHRRTYRVSDSTAFYQSVPLFPELAGIRYGNVTVSDVDKNTYKDVTVTFSNQADVGTTINSTSYTGKAYIPTYAAAPIVLACFSGTASGGTAEEAAKVSAGLSISVHSASTSSFKIRVYNASTTDNVSVSINWVAFGAVKPVSSGNVGKYTDVSTS